MAKKYDVYHDEPTCKEKLVTSPKGWYCPKCNVYPNLSSRLRVKVKRV